MRVWRCDASGEMVAYAKGTATKEVTINARTGSSGAAINGYRSQYFLVYNC